MRLLKSLRNSWREACITYSRVAADAVQGSTNQVAELSISEALAETSTLGRLGRTPNGECMVHTRTGAFEYAQKMADADQNLTRAEALHWLADSEESAEMFVEDMVLEAKKELAKRYPKFIKSFWWKGKAKRWAQET